MKVHRFTLAAVVLTVFILLSPLSAGADQCYSACKEGAPEYKGVTWVCTYDKLGNYMGHGKVDPDNFDFAKCQMTIKGRFSNILLDIGHVKTFDECLTEKCIPKVEDICTEQDRCVDKKNWRKW